MAFAYDFLTKKGRKMGYRVLYLITARAGSKSIPNKNIKILGGRELLTYKVLSAKHVADEEDIWLSTDSEEYAAIGKKAGATIPYIRPAELAQDTTPSVDVVLHAMNYAEEIGRKYDAVCLLEPPVPFVPYEYLKKASDKLFSDETIENVLAVKRVSPGTFFIQEESEFLWKIAENVKKNGGVKRRQDEIPEITPSGCFYFAKWETFKKNKSFYTPKTYAYFVDDIYSTEIDEPKDYLWAQFLLEKRLIDLDKII